VKRALVLFLFINLGCSTSELENSNPEAMPSSIYDFLSARLNTSSGWVTTEGLAQTQFKYDIGEDGETDVSKGTFVIQYTNFRASNLCPIGQSCYCTGFIRGTFTSSEAPQQSEPEPDGPYNPLDPYVGSGGGSVKETLERGGSITIYDNHFVINITEQNLSVDCPPQTNNRKVSFYRYPDSTAVFVDINQYYLRPRSN